MRLDVYLEADISQTTGSPEPDIVGLYSADITHNLGAMAAEFNLYYPLWRPEEINITEAWQLVDLLIDGLEALRSQPDRARIHTPSNSWGSYEGLIKFISSYLDACRKYPKAKVRACR